MNSRYEGTTLIPKDGGTPEDQNKALLDLLGKINDVSANAASASDVTGDTSSLGGRLTTLSKGYRYGLEILYASPDTLTVKPGMAEVDGALVVLASAFSITNAMANFPGAGAWAFATLEDGGTVRLWPAAGAATARPTDNCYQLTGGGVGYDDIKKFAFYYDPKRVILGAIHRVSATAWYIINNETYDNESGENQNGSYKRYSSGKIDQWTWGHTAGNGTPANLAVFSFPYAGWLEVESFLLTLSGYSFPNPPTALFPLFGVTNTELPRSAVSSLTQFQAGFQSTVNIAANIYIVWCMRAAGRWK